MWPLTNPIVSGEVLTAIIWGGATNNQVTEAPKVLMAPEKYKYVELPNSQLELMKILG